MADDALSREVRFSALVERQSRFVFRVAYGVLRDPADAEDIVQETFLKLYRNGGWENMRDEKAFLARVAWRQAVGRLGRSKSSEQLAQPVTHEDSPEDAAINTDRVATVHRLID